MSMSTLCSTYIKLQDSNSRAEYYNMGSPLEGSPITRYRLSPTCWARYWIGIDPGLVHQLNRSHDECGTRKIQIRNMMGAGTGEMWHQEMQIRGIDGTDGGEAGECLMGD